MYAHDPTFAALEVFVDALVRAGLQHVCIAPGARSTPLALVMISHPDLQAWSHVDERSGAFFALGIAKATRQPVAMVCTSGTAAANLLPAIIEAFYAHIPLLVFTADRPPELHDCGANQTIDQTKLYGTHVKWFTEVGTADAGERYFRALGCRAVATAGATPPGPVHLNFPFREPLVPKPAASGEPVRSASGRRIAEAVAQQGTYTVRHAAVAAPSEATVRELAATLSGTPHGLIACGSYDAGAAYAAAITCLAERLRYPIFADPTSQVRTGRHHCALMIDTYDALLRDDALATVWAPDVVVRFGPMPASKAFLRYLQRHPRCRHVVIDPLGGWNDPTGMAAEIVPCDPVATCDALCRCIPTHPSGPRQVQDDDWCAQWCLRDQRARVALARQVDGVTELFEGKVFTELARLLPDGAALYVGNSMPVRDLESYWPSGTRAVRMLCNRGASGIDGFISSGLGAAAVADQPVVMVTGDLGFYHDLNGLLAAKRYGLRATIIVINNDGGGIFSFLPQAACGEGFTEYFLTPHGLDFRGAVEMYGCMFRRIASWEQFRDAVAAALDADRTTVIEVPSNRARNVELHQQVWAAIARAVAVR
ncbi:MAG: 2-succinyl-5-enolpyruvyl-6-hydroxy-3-cyclohexene-1-carboxylic-acid synthase [Candidatus Binatia bacterium]